MNLDRDSWHKYELPRMRKPFNNQSVHSRGFKICKHNSSSITLGSVVQMISNS